MSDKRALAEETTLAEREREGAFEAAMASCHNTWVDVAIVFVGWVAFLASGVFPWAILVTVACMVAWLFVI